MQICRLFLTVFWNFQRITRLSTANYHWVINSQTGPVFLAHPVFSNFRINMVNGMKAYFCSLAIYIRVI